MSKARGARMARGVGGALAACSLVLLACATATGAIALPPPRVIGLQPRVVAVPARVVSLRPRIVSVAPKRTAPNKFTVASDVLFAFDRSNLSSTSRAVLAQLVSHLRHSRPGSVSITGYTDSVGTAAYNLGLSQRRARSVASFLEASVHNSGLTYTTAGRGEADPVAPNTLPNGHDNPAGRAQNRRVVIAYSRRG